MAKENGPPMTADEMQKLLRNGDFKIVMAESPLVDRYETQVRQILVAIGKHMGEEEDAEEWADRAFVSDMSSLGDFGLNDSELVFISIDLGGIPVRKDDYIYALAARMAGVN